MQDPTSRAGMCAKRIRLHKHYRPRPLAALQVRAASHCNVESGRWPNRLRAAHRWRCRIHQAIRAHLNTQKRRGVITRTEKLLRPRQAVTIFKRRRKTATEITGFKPCRAAGKLNFASVAPIVFLLLCGRATAALPPQKPDPAES